MNLKINSKVKKVVEATLKSNANSTTCYNIYQPKAPKTLKKFSKIRDDK